MKFTDDQYLKASDSERQYLDRLNNAYDAIDQLPDDFNGRYQMLSTLDAELIKLEAKIATY